MRYYHSIRSKDLKRQISDYKKIQRKLKGNFSEENYNKQQRLEKEIGRVISSFEENKLHLKTSQYALFAQYISVVASYPAQREELFDILQKKADKKGMDGFDVRAEAQRANLTLFQKIFSKDPNNTPYLSKEKLINKVNDYKESVISWMSRFKAPKMPKLKINKVKISAPKLSKKQQSYLKVASATLLTVIGAALVYRGFNNNNEKEVVNADNTKDKTETSTTPKLGTSNQQTSSVSEAKVITWGEASKKTDFNLQPFASKETKISLVQTKTEPQPQEVMPKKETTSKKVVTSTPKAKNKTITSDSIPVKTTSVINTKELTASEKNAIIEHHSFAVEMRLGKSGAKKLNEKIETLRDKENTILSLPDDISNAEIAYAFVMYRAYGVNSSLENALNSKEKLTAEQNQKVLEDIKVVGSVGEGVKRLAEIQHNGKLNDNSCYNNTSDQNKKIHAKNLRQLRQIQKAKQRAA